VAGGVVLDVSPPRSSRDAHLRLSARANTAREDLPRLLAAERGAVRARDSAILTGSTQPAPARVADWFLREDIIDSVERSVSEFLDSHHREHPLNRGAAAGLVRTAVAAALERARSPGDPDLIDALIERLENNGTLVRDGTAIRLAGHEASLAGRSADVEELLTAIGGENEAKPPTISDLLGRGVKRDVIEAAANQGLVVRVGTDLVFSPRFIERARRVVREAGENGIRVSTFREQLATSRKYAVPLLEWFDQRGFTRRNGDLRFPRSSQVGPGSG
jgi:selenocysteine-specific elongation factor